MKIEPPLSRSFNQLFIAIFFILFALRVSTTSFAFILRQLHRPHCVKIVQNWQLFFHESRLAWQPDSHDPYLCHAEKLPVFMKDFPLHHTSDNLSKCQRFLTSVILHFVQISFHIAKKLRLKDMNAKLCH